MRRIIYSPEVQVYIQPGGFDSNKNPLPPIDISNDIIEGSITRKSDDISNAHFLVQNRRLGGQSGSQDGDFSPPQTLLLSNLRPMDRIVVYLKKTKPILVFSGYLDLVPMLQFVPEPVTIEASCTLKRLEFTYWDPTLPSVMENLMSIGLVPSSAGGDQGLSILQIPANDTSINGIQDTGFPKLIQFLLQDVGGWADKNIFIEPIPQEWMDKATILFNELKGSDTTDTATRAFLSSIVGASNSGSGNGNSDSGPGPNVPVVGGPDYRKTYHAQGGGWQTVTSTFFGGHNDTSAYNHSMANGEIANDQAWGFGETSNNYSAPVSEMDFAALGHLPMGTKIEVRSLKYKGLTVLVAKKDVGGGGPGLNGHKRAIDLCYASAKALGHSGLEDVEWRLYDPKNNPAPNDAGKQRTTSSSRGDVSKKNSKDTLTVYIEAFDCGIPDMRMPGYQDKDILGRVMDTDVRKRVVDYNVTLATMVQSELANLANKDNKSFDITLGTNNSRLNGYEGFNGDVFLTIDHSDWVYSISTDANGHKASDIQRGFCFTANQYSSGLTAGRGGAGAAWRLPNTVGGRKTNAANEKPLVTNSNALLKAFKDAYTGKPFNATLEGDGHSVSVGPFTIPDFNPVIDDPHNFIPGFYYSTATACMYLELPTVSLQIPSGTGNNMSLNDNSDLKKLFQMRAKQIAQGLYNYWKNYKNKGSQKAVSAGDFSQISTSSTSNNTVANNSTVSSGKLPYVDPKAPSRNPLGLWWKSDQGAVNDGIIRVLGILEAKFSGLHPSCLTGQGPHPHNQFVKGTNRQSQHWTGDAVDIQFAGGGPNDQLAKVAQWIYDTGLWKACDQVIFEKSGSGPGRSLFVISKGSIVNYNFAGDHTDHIHIGINRSNVQAALNALDNLADAPVGGGTGSGDASGNGTGGNGTSGSGSGSSVQDSLNAAFNVSFNFPGSMADSLILRGQRALENDVPLIDSVAEAVKASMRSFSSLPDGSFVAWYPDYFNISKRTAWLKISPMELKSCTIDLSDKSLATHVYILGNPHGIGSLPEAAAASTWLEKLRGTGVVTIEQSKILDSFVGGNGFDDYLDFLDYNGLPKTNSKQVTVKDKRKKKKRTRTVESQISDKVSAPLTFLERYGARPYVEQNLTIRHPLFEFFYAYHTFIRKWAEQFVSKVEFTFMPELFPGMIIEIDDPHRRNITFYVQDVTHNFSYESGFNTSATLIAPGVATKGKITQKNPAYGMIPVTLQAAVPADSESDNNTSSNTTSGNGHRNKRNIPTYKQWLKKHHWGATPARKKQYDKLYKKNKE